MVQHITATQTMGKYSTFLRMLRREFRHILSPLMSKLTGLCIRLVPILIVMYCLWIFTHYLYPKKETVLIWPQNQTRHVPTLICPTQTTTILSPKNACLERTENKSFILIVVCSAVPNINRRQVIRDTWAMDAMKFPGNVDVIFLLGRSANPTDMVQSAIEEEAAMHVDILQESFVDTYANLTIKSLMMLKWFANHCTKHYQYLMKTDDDMYINISGNERNKGKL